MDGDLDDFIAAYLKASVDGRKSIKAKADVHDDL
jgi:hypothetical protein